MSLHDSIVRLEQALADLDAALDDIILSSGDVPDPDDEPALVPALRDRVMEIRGELHAAAAAARSSAIIDAHAAFNAAARRLHLELTTTANAEEIAAIAFARGGSWNRWSDVLRRALDNTAALSDAGSASLLDCWREVVAQYRIPA